MWCRSQSDNSTTSEDPSTPPSPARVGTSCSVCQSSLVGSHALDHELFLFLAEALSPHGRIGHPDIDKDSQGDADGAVSDEECLVRLERSGSNETEAVRQ